MKWPSADKISEILPLPAGYRYEILTHAEVPALIEGIRQWHPDIAVGGGSCGLREDFYDNYVCWAETINGRFLWAFSSTVTNWQGSGRASRSRMR